MKKFNLTGAGLNTSLIPGATIGVRNVTENFDYAVLPNGLISTAISADHVRKSKSQVANALADKMINEESFTIEMRISVTNDNLLLFYTDGKRNAVKANIKNGVLTKKVNIRKNDKGIYQTDTATDTVRYAWIDQEKKLVRFGNLCIVSQNQSLFLSVQEVYGGAISYFRKGNKVVFPRIEEERPQYADLWRTSLDWSSVSCPTISKYSPKPEVDYKSLLKKREAYVDFFLVSERTGLATILNNRTGEPMKVKLHYKQVFVADDTLVELNTGDIVSFDSVVPVEGNGPRVSSLKFQLAGIRKK